MQPRRALTLTELLVTIAVIGILLSILIPVIGRVRQTAQATVCATNLRQLGQAMALYAHQNDDNLPGGIHFVLSDPTLGGGTRCWSWDDAIAPLLGNPPPRAELMGRYTANPSPLLHCPSDDREPLVANGKLLGGLRSYSMTEAAVGDTTSVWGMGAGISSPGRHVRLAEATDPARTLLLVENHTGLRPGEGNIAGEVFGATTRAPFFQRDSTAPVQAPLKAAHMLPPAHTGSWNYLFCDGHFERLRPSETVTANPGVSLDNLMVYPSGMWTRDPKD